jgi:hypothetical protein
MQVLNPKGGLMKFSLVIISISILALFVGCQQQPAPPPAGTTPAGTGTPAAAPATPAPPAAPAVVPAAAKAGGYDLSKPGKPANMVGPGDVVWAIWSDRYFYIATITGMKGNNFLVNYADGDTGEVAKTDVRQFGITNGQVLESVWSGGGYWPAKIIAVRPDSVDVEFLDDHSHETHYARDLRTK